MQSTFASNSALLPSHVIDFANEYFTLRDFGWKWARGWKKNSNYITIMIMTDPVDMCSKCER